jgi:hypothetical protein
MTLEQFIANSPPDVGAMIQEGLVMRENKKASLVKTLTDNQNCPFTQQQLQAKSIPELQALVQLAGMNIPRHVDYSGQGGQAQPVQTFKRNERQPNGMGVPDMPNIVDLMKQKKA